MQEHKDAIKHVLGELKGTKDYKKIHSLAQAFQALVSLTKSGHDLLSDKTTE